jgi:cytochrome oxidase Cu insertion factor (SCO1/SenC/PrrC family)
MSKLPVIMAFAGGIAVAAGGFSVFSRPEPQARSAAALMDVVMWNKEPIGGPFDLVDHNGNRRTDVDFRGKLLLVYFGFTFCADVCPIDLQSIATTLDRLGPSGEAVQPLFITIDPEKDTPAQLKGYVSLIHPRLIGLTGDRKRIRRVALDYKVFYAKTVPAKKDDVGFDHSGFVYVIGRDGKYIGYFPPGTPAERMVETIQPLLVTQPQS